MAILLQSIAQTYSQSMAHRICSVLRTLSRDSRIFVHRQKLDLSPVLLSRNMVSYAFRAVIALERNVKYFYTKYALSFTLKTNGSSINLSNCLGVKSKKMSRLIFFFFLCHLFSCKGVGIAMRSSLLVTLRRDRVKYI